MTRVVFCDPTSPDQCQSAEFFLDGFALEDLEWFHACDLVTYEYVEWLVSLEEKEPGTLRLWNETIRALDGL